MMTNATIETCLHAVMHEPMVYVLIINYNGFLDTINCLESLNKIRYRNLKIIVIDNASANDSVMRIVSWLELCGKSFDIIDINKRVSSLNAAITLIRSKINYGFGGANNIGIQMALDHKIPYVLLLNNDTIVDEHFLDYLLKTMCSANSIGMVGGKIFYMEERNRIWYCGGWIDYKRGAAYHMLRDKNENFETTLVTGCLALLNVAAIRDVGLFDERFFLNVEDWDLSYRMRTAGWRLIVAPQAVVYHKISASIGGPHSLRNQYYFHRNRLLFFDKHLNPFNKLIFFFAQAAIIIPAWLVKQTFRGRFSEIKAFFLGTRDFFHGKFGKSASV